MIEIYTALAIIVALLVTNKGSFLLAFNRRLYLRWLAILGAVCAAHTAGYLLEPASLIQNLNIFRDISPVQLLGVWWEDVLFVLPFLFVRNVWLARVLMLPAAIYFASGHLYQGDAGWITIIYPYIAYEVSRRHGFLTMTALHITYDMALFTAMYMAAILL